MSKMHQAAVFSGKAIFLSVVLWSTGCKKEDDHQKVQQHYAQVNLVANNDEYVKPAHEDKNLLNAWGLAFSPTGIPWVSSQAGHVSTIYNSEGETLLGPVNIPSPGDENGGGNPTGIVFNPVATEFVIPSGDGSKATGARFIFVGVDGVVSGWNGTRGTQAYRKLVTTGVYTGLAYASNNGANYLYGANFKTGKIDVWDKDWNLVTSMSFTDPNLPANYAPFNIQAIGDKLYAIYAESGGDEEVQGVGKGLVDVFTTGGEFVKRFTTGGLLNAPWGVALAPETFDGNNGQGRPMLLVGNLGDGHINAYNAKNGKFLGQLTDKNNKVIAIEGLWALSFPPSGSNIDANRLYFTAGPDDEQDGLFGYLSPDGTSGHDMNGDY